MSFAQIVVIDLDIKIQEKQVWYESKNHRKLVSGQIPALLIQHSLNIHQHS